MSSWIKSIKEVLKRNKYDKENNITRRNTILDEMSLDNFDEEKYKDLIKQQVQEHLKQLQLSMVNLENVMVGLIFLYIQDMNLKELIN